jgi:Transposase DDE domain
MQPKYAILFQPEQEEISTSQHFAQVLESFLAPLLLVLDQVLDKRLVRTLVQCCVAILRFRNSKQALLLSELGSYMGGYLGLSSTATAGTKRLGKLLRSLKWSAGHIDRFLLEEASQEVERLKAQGKRILCLFDGSVLEKPESRKLEATAPVLSSKAKRLNRSRMGLLFNLPSLRPIRVMGMEWTGTIITGLEGIPRLAVMRWWTTKGDYGAKLREIEEEVLRVLVRRWGPLLTFVFDRGYASGPWLEVLERFRVRFIIRWIKKHIFLDQEGREKKLWEIGRGKRYLAHQLIRESSSGLKLTCDLWWAPLRHPKSRQQLYLVKARLKGHVCYLITNERVQNEAQAWEIFFAYKRRWQIETSFRSGKCELALESPRLWSLDNRLKLLGIVLLVSAFLLFLLEEVHAEHVQALMRLKCHRTGKRCHEALVPLYRLRWALSRLWNDCRPILGSILPPNLETLQALALLRC